MDYSVETLEVIKIFLATNEAKKVDPQFLQSKENLSPLQYFQKVHSSFARIEEKNLKKMVSHKPRLKRFLCHHWFLKSVPLKYIGGWPHIGDLPESWCQGSVVDVAHIISDYENMNHYSSIKRIKSMSIIIGDILSFFPPILVQGSEIRKQSNLLFLPFDVDDGSHRCIAAVLSGKRVIKAYVGAM